MSSSASGKCSLEIILLRVCMHYYYIKDQTGLKMTSLIPIIYGQLIIQQNLFSDRPTHIYYSSLNI